MRALLVSTYDLGRQPLGLAAPAASLRAAGVAVTCVDASRVPLEDEQIRAATIVGFYLAMHTATRLAAPLITRARQINPAASLVAYGLYAPLNQEWLEAQGVQVLGAEGEGGLLELVEVQRSRSGAQRSTPAAPRPQPSAGSRTRGAIIPLRAGLPPLHRYAALQMPDGSRRVAGSTDATRGCKHLCRHCPIVPVYHGRFRAVPVDAVLADIGAQVAAGAQHISFGDPDFFNGPTHARRIVEALAARWPGLSYDATIKIEHLLAHAALLPLLRDTGCLFVTSAVESVDDAVLARLRKGHTRADFQRAVALCRAAGLTLAPTFVPFTPWTTIDGYVDLLRVIDNLELVAHVAPIQLAIRLLVTARSALLELEDIRAAVDPFDAASLVYPWRHSDPRVDALHAGVMELVTAAAAAPRAATFAGIRAIACGAAGIPTPATPPRAGAPVPTVTEPWYCCAEPTPQQLGAI